MKNINFNLNFKNGNILLDEIKISSGTVFSDLIDQMTICGLVPDGHFLNDSSPIKFEKKVSFGKFIFKAEAYFSAQKKINTLSLMLLNGESNSDQTFEYQLVVSDKKKISKYISLENNFIKEIATPERDVFSFKWGRVVVEANPLSMCCHMNVVYQG